MEIIGYLMILAPFVFLMIASMFAGWRFFFFVWGFVFFSIASIYTGLVFIFGSGG